MPLIRLLVISMIVSTLKSDTQADAFNKTSRYLDDSFNIDNPFLILCILLYTCPSSKAIVNHATPEVQNES